MKRFLSAVLGVALVAFMVLAPALPDRRRKKVLDAAATQWSESIKAAMGPPRPPLTRWERFEAWIGRNIIEPGAQALANVLIVIGIAWAAHIGWELGR